MHNKELVCTLSDKYIVLTKFIDYKVFTAPVYVKVFIMSLYVHFLDQIIHSCVRFVSRNKLHIPILWRLSGKKNYTLVFLVCGWEKLYTHMLGG